MSEQPRPADQTIIAIQKQEIDRCNDNRIYLMALMEEVRAEATSEIGRLNGVISQLKGMLGDDVIEEAEKIIGG